jgi:hypothetical protein
VWFPSSTGEDAKVLREEKAWLQLLCPFFLAAYDWAAERERDTKAKDQKIETYILYILKRINDVYVYDENDEHQV